MLMITNDANQLGTWQIYIEGMSDASQLFDTMHDGPKMPEFTMIITDPCTEDPSQPCQKLLEDATDLGADLSALNKD